MKHALLVLLGSLITTLAFSQNVGIGTSNPKGKLEIEADNEGVIIPRVELTALNSAAPLTTPEVSELVYNTATAGSGATAVTPGFYYWSGSAWVRLQSGAANLTGSTSIGINGNSIERTALTGDVTAAANNNATTVTRIQGRDVVTTAPTASQVLKWNGTAWAPAADENITYTSGSGIDVSGGVITATSPSKWTINGTNLYPNDLTLNVGIGTADSRRKMHISGVSGDGLAIENLSNTAGNFTGIFFKVNNTNADNNFKSGILFERTATNGRGSIHFATNNVNDATNIGLADASMTIASNGRVGIGITNPVSDFHIRSSGSDAAMRIESNNSSTTAPAFFSIKRRGTAAAPEAILSGDDLLLLRAYGFDGTSNIEAARITFDSEGIIDNGIVPGLISFSTRNVSAGQPVERMRIASNGNVGIGTAAPAARLHTLMVHSSTEAIEDVAILGSTTTASARLVTRLSNSATAGNRHVQLQVLQGTTNTTPRALSLQPDGGNVGIGTTNPVHKLHIVDETANPIGIFEYNDGAGGVNLRSYRARGTASAPASLQLNDQLLLLSSFGYDGSSFQNRAQISMLASENWSSTATGTRILFGTTANGTTTFAERMRIEHNGNIAIGTSTIAQDFSSQGFTSLELRGTTAGGVFQISSAAADADNRQIGQLQWIDINNSNATNKVTASIFAGTSGTTSNNRGSILTFSTRANNATSTTERMRINNIGNVTINNLAGTGNRNVYADANGTLVAGVGGQGFEHFNWSKSGTQSSEITETLRPYPEWYCSLGGTFEGNGAGESCRVYVSGSNWVVGYKSQRSGYICYAHCIR